jgi:ATP-dependent DNA ligase
MLGALTQRGRRRESRAVSRASSSPAIRRYAGRLSPARWIHEIKFEGYRTRAYLRNGCPAIYTRRRL